MVTDDTYLYCVICGAETPKNNVADGWRRDYMTHRFICCDCIKTMGEHKLGGQEMVTNEEKQTCMTFEDMNKRLLDLAQEEVAVAEDFLEEAEQTLSNAREARDIARKHLQSARLANGLNSDGAPRKQREAKADE